MVMLCAGGVGGDDHDVCWGGDDHVCAGRGVGWYDAHAVWRGGGGGMMAMMCAGGGLGGGV